MLNKAPDILTNSLDKAIDMHRDETSRSFLLSKVKYLLLLCLVLFFADMIFHLSGVARLLLLAFYALVGMGLLALYVYNKIFKPINYEHVARLLESRDASLGSKLINSLQLTNELNDPKVSALKKNLIVQAIEQSLQGVQAKPLHTILVNPARGKEFKIAFLIVFFFGLLLLSFSSVSKLELLRYLDPFGDHPPFSLTSLSLSEPAEETVSVVYGEGLTVQATYQGHKPDELFLTYQSSISDKSISLPMYDKGELGFSQRIDLLHEDGSYFVHTKDNRSVSKKKNIKVLLTPNLLDANVTIVYPEYTQQKPVLKKYRMQPLTILKGSYLTFDLVSNRPLKSGQIDFMSTDHKTKFDLMRKDEHSVGGDFIPPSSGVMSFVLHDIKGIASNEVIKGAVTLTDDQVPTVSIEYPETNSYVTQDYKVDSQIVASDDFGINTVRVYRSINGRISPPKDFSWKEEKLSLVKQNYLFDIGSLGVVPGDVIGMYAEVIDNCPDTPHVAKSDVVFMVVVSVEEYNQYLRERASIDEISGKYEELIDELHKLAEEQKELNEKIREVKEKIAKGIDDPQKNKEELNALLAKQNELSEKMENLANRMEKFGRDDPLYDIEKEFEEVLKAKAKEIKDALSENKNALEAFDKSVNEGDKGPNQVDALKALESLGQAGEQLAKKLTKKSEELKEEIAETIEDLEKMNSLIEDFNLFKALYEEQNMVAIQMKALSNLSQLSTEDRLVMKNLSAEQRQIQKSLGELKDRLKKNSVEAMETFPKAAQSAEKLANAIEDLRLVENSEKASQFMNLLDASNSNTMAERVRQDMFSLFSQPCFGNSCNKSEMDSYLKLKMGMNAGESFQQMCESMKFGSGQGSSRSGGAGSGQNQGASGSQSGGSSPKMGLLGNEKLASKSANANSQSKKSSSGTGRAQENEIIKPNLSFSKEENATQQGEKEQKTKGSNGRSVYSEYEGLIDAYFETITK